MQKVLGNTIKSARTEAIDTLPIATNVNITGTLEIGKTLTANYEYFDANGDKESGTTYQWYANGEEINGATTQALTIKPAQQGKKITVKVTPKNKKGIR